MRDIRALVDSIVEVHRMSISSCRRRRRRLNNACAIIASQRGPNDIDVDDTARVARRSPEPLAARNLRSDSSANCANANIMLYTIISDAPIAPRPCVARVHCTRRSGGVLV